MAGAKDVLRQADEKPRGLPRAQAGSRRIARRGRVNASDAYFTVLERLRPHSYDETRSPGAFFAAATPQEYAAPAELPRRLYTLWTGINPMSDDGRRGLDSLRRLDDGIELMLGTPADLDKHLISGHPLDPAYNGLLPRPQVRLPPLFLHALPRRWVCRHQDLPPRLDRILGDGRGSTPRPGRSATPRCLPRCVANCPAHSDSDLRRHYRALIGNGAYLIQPEPTPLTQLWYVEVLRNGPLRRASRGRARRRPWRQSSTRSAGRGCWETSCSRSACGTPTA